jgi:hypothetical protein
MGEAKRQASNVADAANTAARKTASSFETAAREIIENQPYTAVGAGAAKMRSAGVVAKANADWSRRGAEQAKARIQRPE